MGQICLRGRGIIFDFSLPIADHTHEFLRRSAPRMPLSPFFRQNSTLAERISKYWEWKFLEIYCIFYQNMVGYVYHKNRLEKNNGN